MNSTWTDFLAQQGASFDENRVRFGAPLSEVRAAAQGTALVPLTHLGLIRATGEEAATFLHSLFSNDVKQLSAASAQWNSFNSAKGRMLANMLIWRQGADYLLALSADIHPAILRKLGMYVLRSKVKLTDATQAPVLLGVSGPGAESLLLGQLPALPAGAMECAPVDGGEVIRLPDGSFVIAVAPALASTLFTRLREGGAIPAGTAAWEAAQIRAGLPLLTQPVQEEFVPQMLNFEILGGVSFTKGCYPGQEVVARTRYLGKIKKRMYRVHLPVSEAPLPGTDLFAPEFGDQSAGKLVNVAPAAEAGFDALVVLQNSSVEAGEVHLASPTGPRVDFLELPYALD